jgi:hypothetical protein
MYEVNQAGFLIILALKQHQKKLVCFVHIMTLIMEDLWFAHMNYFLLFPNLLLYVFQNGLMKKFSHWQMIWSFKLLENIFITRP